MNLFEDYFLNVIKQHYADFSGRATRSEYWYFVLFQFLVGIAVSIVVGILGSIIGEVAGLLSLVYSLGLLLPGVAVAIRRLHDTGKSGWWLLIGLVPFVGFIILIVFMIQDSEVDRNQYGPNPKRGAVA